MFCFRFGSWPGVAFAFAMVATPVITGAATFDASWDTVTPSALSPLDAQGFLGAPSAPRRDAVEPFGRPVAALTRGSVADKWRDLQVRLQAESKIILDCRDDMTRCDLPAAKRFLAIVAAAQSRDGRARIGEINRQVNLAIKPVDDLDQYHVPDYWASPLTTLSSRQGDCEDYAIVKLAALHSSGFSWSDLRLVVVQDPTSHEDHAVAAVRFEGRWLLLDNRRLALVDADHSFYRPLLVLRQNQDAIAPAMARAPADAAPPQGLPSFTASAGLPILS